MTGQILDQHVEAIRRFNRFYTTRIGVLQEHLLESPFSVTEARVMYELARREQTTAPELGDELGLDAGYLGRILGRFRRRGLLRIRSVPGHGRPPRLSLSDRGQDAFARLNMSSRTELAMMLTGLPVDGRTELVQAAETIERLLGAPVVPHAGYLLRHHRPGDMGWVVQRHAELYALEYDWNEEFEGLVAEIVARFLRRHDPKRERCWIAEKDGENVGSVFLVQKTRTVAQLRLLLVDPRARGLGIGARLVDECTQFARGARYRSIVLWTNSVLDAARRLYEKAGYRLVREEAHHSFGKDLTGQTWQLTL